MLKAVFRPNELVTLQDKVIIESPNSYSEITHLSTMDDEVEDISEVDEYSGPTADDLRREAEMFKAQWEGEKERMISSAKEEAENIVKTAQDAAFAEVKRQTDEAQIIKQQAEDEALRITDEARLKANEMEAEVRRTLDDERGSAKEAGKKEGKEEGYAEGKAEVDRLIERTQIVLERAQDKRGEILSDTEQEIISLVLMISRKVIKVLSENQKDIIIANVIEALRKVKAKGNVIIRVNLADLQLATEHKQDFIKLMEGAKSVQIAEDSSVDKGGCIIETDFGEIDARIASQLAELENRILEIAPSQGRTPPPVIKTANLNKELAATSMMDDLNNAAADSDASIPDSDDPELSSGASAALTASAALAALATMATKGKREVDKKLTAGLDSLTRRKSDS